MIHNKMMNLSLTLLLVAGSFAMATDSLDFRGPNRDGHFPEKGLLKSWPEGGPKLIWEAEGLGQAYASVSVKDNKVYTTGKIDKTGYLFAYDENGKQIYKIEYGPENEGSGFPGARSTPTIRGDHLYITTGPGKVLCFNRNDGSLKWEVDLVAKYGSKEPQFAFSESVLVDGDKVICTPGGKDASLVALNAKTGEQVWQTKGLSDEASYCSARIFDNGKHRFILTMTAKSMVGVNPNNGEVLFVQDYPATYNIHAVSPVFDGNMIYISDGYKKGGAMFELAADGRSVTQKWTEPKLDIHHGGIVLHDGHVYGASSNGIWAVLDLKTGEMKAKFRDLGKGAIIFADGLLYGYDEKGRVGIVNPDPNNFKVISQFEITKGDGQHWSHPVISNGRLYIRHGNALMVFDIKA